MTESETPKSNRPMPILDHEALRANLPYPAAGLLPHGEPFALIDTIVEEWDMGGKTSSVVHPDHPLAGADGVTGAETFIEYGAQTAAVLDAYQRQDKSFGGLLVEVVDSEYTAIPRVGDTVDVIINVQYDLGKWRGIGYEAFLNGKPAAKGTLKLFLTNYEEKK